MDAIFFDLDGTLTDPKIGITRSIQHALQALEKPVPEEADLLWCIGPPLQASFRKLLTSEALAEQAVALYRARYAQIGLFENALYDGIPPVLTRLNAAGYRLFVATSKPTIFADQIIDRFALRPYFERVFGSELDGVRGDKSELFGYALQRVGLDGARCAMVGDRSFDMLGASAHAMTAIGVLCGYGNAAELQSSGAHHLCARPQDIGDLVLSLAQ